MKKPAAQPTAWRTPCAQRLRNQRAGQRSGHSAIRKETNEQAPKTASTHEPADIGDQYLSIGAWAARRQPSAENGKPAAKAPFVTSDLSSMCQKRPGLSRSMMRHRAQTTISGKAIQ